MLDARPPYPHHIIITLFDKNSSGDKVFLIFICAKKITTKRWLNLGGGTETRTLDPMIKSHLLYQLSYASMGTFCKFGGNSDIKKTKMQEKIAVFCFFTLIPVV